MFQITKISRTLTKTLVALMVPMMNEEHDYIAF
jgi:hypothetical protein